MDFLDPRRRRAHKYRLIIGYFLVAIVIALGTVILVYGAYGYGINTKTGQIIENGLLFVDSKPGGADIYLNGKAQPSKTAARLVLSARNYNLEIKKDGYHPWQRSFVLDEHSVARYVYPFLWPLKPATIPLKTYPSQPQLVTETPDRHFLLVQLPDSDSLAFDQYDTGNLAKAPTQITLPRSLLGGTTGSVFKEVEWSTNNNNLLIDHTFNGGHEFLVLDRNNPDQSFNVNRLFNSDPTEVALKNKRIDQLYLYDQTNSTLQIGDSGKGSLDPPFLKHVLAFKPYGNTLLTYVTDVGAPSGKVAARIWDDGKTYPLYIFNAGQKYLIDAAQFQGHWYYVAGSDTTERINVFKDPIDSVRDPQIGKAIPTIALHAQGATKLSFSNNTRFIGIEAGQTFAAYDLETQESYHYTIQSPLSDVLHWMDGHRWIGLSGGNVFVMDYDHTNQQLLGPSLIPQAALFSRDYNQMITLAPVSSSDSVTLTRIDLRAGKDLPKDLAQ
jgi:hypothetical protein